jgi:hypothetical protein
LEKLKQIPERKMKIEARISKIKERLRKTSY